jgi:hypothetical protein
MPGRQGRPMGITLPIRGLCAVVVSSALVIALLGLGRPVEARITQLIITTRTSPAFGGASFGDVGPYEQLDGTAVGEVDPKDPLNAVIQDIGLAPRNARGNVEYSMNVSILKPIDMSRGNHTLLYDVVNRGNKLVTNLNIGGSATTPGDGFLERQGYTLAWSGWEGDITGGIRINLPIAKNPDGSDITGRVRAEYILGAPATTQNVTAPPVYQAVSTRNADATLTRRIHQRDPRELIPNSQWAFADCTSTPFPGVPDPTKVCLQGGFDTNHIYELVYTAKNPTVAGLGFAATRDFISFLRNGNGNGSGNDPNGHKTGATMLPPFAPNPLGNAIHNAVIFGSSQSGRWIRTFIHLGFNQDEGGAQVTDGAMPHIASNRGAFNIRFAQPTRLSGTQHTEVEFPGAESPGTWGTTNDKLSGVKGGQLERCSNTQSCPKIIQTVSDSEYWQSLMSLNTTDSSGTQDFELPKDVRLFQFSSTQHGGGNPLVQPPAVLPNVPNNCQLRANSNPYVWHQRALLVALREWVVNGTSPPDSLYSSLSARSLVSPSQLHIPYIPAVNFTLPGLANQKFVLDRGPQYDVEDVSGIMAEPPVQGAAYPVLLPQVDADGNDIDGLRNTNVQVPLGTYTGWNIRKAGFSEGDSCDLTGAFIPFFRTRAERLAAGDPRLSLEERYPTHADYVNAITGAANGLVIQRLLLPEDAASIISAASAATVP